MGLFDRFKAEKVDEPDHLWPYLKTPARAKKLSDEGLKSLISLGAVHYGETNNNSMVVGLKAIYDVFVARLAPAERSELCSELQETIKTGSTSATALLPFLEMDPDPTVASTAAFGFSVLFPPNHGDPMTGPEVVLNGLVGGSAVCPGGLLGGLLLLADERVNTLVWGRKDELPNEVVDVAIECQRGFLSWPLVDFLMSWMEERPGGDDDALFGVLAAGLTKCREGPDPIVIVDAERHFPAPTAKTDPVRVKRRWSLNEFTEFVSPRLLALESKDPGQKVMPEVLRTWRIGQEPEIQVEDEPETPAEPETSAAPETTKEVEEPKALPWEKRRVAAKIAPEPEPKPESEPEPKPNAEPETEPAPEFKADPGPVVFARVSERYRDFEGAFPEPLSGDAIFAELFVADLVEIVKWGTFDPFGPTLAVLGLLPVPGEDATLVVLRTNHPRTPTVEVVGLTQRRTKAEPGELVDLATAIGAASVERSTPILASLPTHVVVAKGISLEQARTVFMNWARLCALPGVDAYNERALRHWLKPWDCAREALTARIDAIESGTACESAVPSEGDLARWWSIVTDPQHLVAEFEAIPVAWGAALNAQSQDAGDDATDDAPGEDA